ncbi:pentatricopeptide repeat-containing protein At1g08070, chloroplastic-like [Arachis hypogaea]|uniref:pentatricopeptide repeat-containing protein At1g08070, chloroplastic-like n=1 Tax=Arachis hypogaea TaxID=3818 RepID=UPI000DECFAFD|nr:pentatricopeptide repeat-containing protein At1g08070, chloroplastic-like [Arachis hypogaea]
MAELKQNHSLLIRLGLSSDNHAISPLIIFSSLSPHGDLRYAATLFFTLTDPDTFLFNTLIRAFSLSQTPSISFLFYSDMLYRALSPNNFTFPSLIKSSSPSAIIHHGRQVHAHVLKFGFGSDVYALNALAHMYVIFGLLGDARKVFDRMPVRIVVSWTIMISGYAQWGLWMRLSLFSSSCHKRIMLLGMLSLRLSLATIGFERLLVCFIG